MSNVFKKNTTVRTLFFLILLFAQMTPIFVYALTIEGFIDSATAVLSSFIPTFLGLAVLVFFWGLVKFIYHADDEKTLEEGKQLMIWGTIVIFIIVSLWGIIGWMQYQFGIGSAPPLTTLWSQPDSVPNL